MIYTVLLSTELMAVRSSIVSIELCNKGVSSEWVGGQGGSHLNKRDDFFITKFIPTSSKRFILQRMRL